MAVFAGEMDRFSLGRYGDIGMGNRINCWCLLRTKILGCRALDTRGGLQQGWTTTTAVKDDGGSGGDLVVLVSLHCLFDVCFTLTAITGNHFLAIT